MSELTGSWTGSRSAGCSAPAPISRKGIESAKTKMINFKGDGLLNDGPAFMTRCLPRAFFRNFSVSAAKPAGIPAICRLPRQAAHPLFPSIPCRG
ncbi:MAG: hypothetical protein C6W57_00690 [Caldibacillus debilis]|nr:MAG: hypothetical protein C6W57_00690 [Caldibacillus debilis]